MLSLKYLFAIEITSFEDTWLISSIYFLSNSKPRSDVSNQARVAAFLGGLGRGSENLGATGVRSDWMEQDGPAFGVLFSYEDTGYRYSSTH